MRKALFARVMQHTCCNRTVCFIVVVSGRCAPCRMTTCEDLVLPLILTDDAVMEGFGSDNRGGEVSAKSVRSKPRKERPRVRSGMLPVA